jgi:hypothetical protein
MANRPFTIVEIWATYVYCNALSPFGHLFIGLSWTENGPSGVDMLKTNLFRYTSLFVLVFLVTTTTFADTVRLKDGSIIKGKIVGFTGGKFTIEVGEGSRKRELSFDAGEVESIEFETIVRQSSSDAATASTVPTSTKRNEVVVRDTIERKGAEPVAKDEPVKSTPTDAVQLPVSTNSATSKPIELSIKVLADNTFNGWTNSGWVVKKGQRIKITGAGEISLGNGKSSNAGGLWDVEDETKLLKAVPTGALIAVIGDNNNDFIYIGNEREFVASRDGALFLGVNEGNLNDNTGAFTVKIEIFPGS